jgi:hypothetical protein
MLIISGFTSTHCRRLKPAMPPTLYDVEHKLHPPLSSSAKDRATFLHLQQYIIATVYPFLASLFIHTLKPTDEQDVALIACAKEKFTALLGPTLVKFLGSSEYLFHGG